MGKWIERTPEYQAKLDAKREAKRAAEEAKQAAEREAAERAEREAREAREAMIKAQKAISQYVGQVGEKVDFKGTYVRTGSWQQKAFGGYGTDTMYIHTFKDSDGNVFTWKTQKNVDLNYGEPVDVRGTVKEHSEYKDEKQTALTRCKITAAFNVA
jgi:multidrug efflux pump subunit AcrA (membrane-fusion protein)